MVFARYPKEIQEQQFKNTSINEQSYTISSYIETIKHKTSLKTHKNTRVLTLSCKFGWEMLTYISSSFMGEISDSVLTFNLEINLRGPTCSAYECIFSATRDPWGRRFLVLGSPRQAVGAKL